MANGIDVIANLATNVTALNTSAVTGSLQTANLGTIAGTIKPLLITIAAIVIYSLAIFKFYRFLAERDILKLKLAKKRGAREGFFGQVITILSYLLEHVVMVPIIVFFWFAVLAVILFFLSRNAPEHIMLVAMAIIGAVRITSYHSEDLSRDLAKMIPFTLLGVVLIDSTYVSVAASLASLKEMPLLLDKAVFYLLFIAALELLMRILFLAISTFKPQKAVQEED